MPKLVIVTRAFDCVPREDALHAERYGVDSIVTGFPASVALRNGWGVAAEEIRSNPSDQSSPDGAGGSDGSADLTESEATSDDDVGVAGNGGAAPVMAKVRRAITLEIDGVRSRLARGAIVEGALAERLIAEGVATPIADNKSAGPAPEIKA